MPKKENKFGDPDNFTGIWFCIHILSLRAKTIESMRNFVNELVYILGKIQCDNCRNHALNYIKTNPIEKYFKLRDSRSGILIGMFYYTWEFHNSVNRRLGKKEMDFYTALQIYSSAETCKDCGNDIVKDEMVKKVLGKRKKYKMAEK